MNTRPEKNRTPVKLILILLLAGSVITGMVLLFHLFSLEGSGHGSRDDMNGSGDPALSIPVIKSPVDFNDNGIDDYMDFVIGAREYIAKNPRYDDRAYFSGGYPPDEVGVCTDVVWQAFKNAGYSLKDMVDTDIINNRSDYPRIKNPEPNIDFRRVKNLKVFFDKYAVSLTTDINEVEEWNAGDIVTSKNPGHISIISDKRNAHGVPYIIHNGGTPQEADVLKYCQITGHYRFDASKIDSGKLIKFEQPIG